MSGNVLIPTKASSMRACIGCGLLLDQSTWENTTCPNCKFEASIGKKYYEEYTSASYNGVIAIFQPEKSWCAAWQKYKSNQPGLYCIDNLGEVTDKILDHLLRNKRPLPEWVERYKTLKEKKN